MTCPDEVESLRAHLGRLRKEDLCSLAVQLYCLVHDLHRDGVPNRAHDMRVILERCDSVSMFRSWEPRP